MTGKQVGALCRILPVILLWASVGSAQAQEWTSEPEPVYSCSVDASNVHIFLCESPVDPLHVTRLPKLQRRLEDCGLPNVTLVKMKSEKRLAEKIRALKCSNPACQIVLLGWSGGSLTVYDTLELLQCDGICVDRVIYMDSKWIEKRVINGHPGNVGEIVTIYRYDRDPPPCLPYTRLYRVTAKWHLEVPGSCDTLRAVLAEVQTLCASNAESIQSWQSSSAPGIEWRN